MHYNESLAREIDTSRFCKLVECVQAFMPLDEYGDSRGCGKGIMERMNHVGDIRF